MTMTGPNPSDDTGIPARGIVHVVVVIIQMLLSAFVLILGTAFVLGLLGANPDAAFAQWIYARTDDLMRPFAGIFDPIELTEGTTIRTSLLFAIVVYAVGASAVGALERRFA